MASIGVTVHFKDVEKKLKALGKSNSKKLMLNITLALAILIQSIAKKGISRGMRTGNVREDGSISSAAGEYPKTDTGNLVNSIFYEQIYDGVKVGSSGLAPYAQELEFGRHDMEPRPWLNPSLEKALKSKNTIFKKEIARYIKSE